MSEFRSQLITKPSGASRSTARVSVGREGSLQTVIDKAGVVGDQVEHVRTVAAVERAAFESGT
jgi:hypothetical protein